MKAINIGLPRTGTSSLCAALRILGMDTVHEAARQIPMRLANVHKLDSLDVDTFRVFDGKGAISECFYWYWFAEAYPEAKLILSYRSPATWFDSIKAHIDIIHSKGNFSEVKQKNVDLAHTQLFGHPCPTRALYIDRYTRHRDYAELWTEKRKRSLLIFRPQDGWEPLCEYLGKPVPRVPYPWNNRLVSKQ